MTTKPRPRQAFFIQLPLPEYMPSGRIFPHLHLSSLPNCQLWKAGSGTCQKQFPEKGGLWSSIIAILAN